jgi:hypothetical protein
MYLSWFSLAKLVELAPKVSKDTFKSISGIPEDYDEYINKINQGFSLRNEGFCKEALETIRSPYFQDSP